MEIQLTDTYTAVMPNPSGRTSGTPWDDLPRPGDFWRDFRIQVVSDGKVLSPCIYSGEPNYIRDGGTQPIATGEYCSLTGATVEMEFLADAVDSTYAAVKIVPREGDQVDANFELYSLR